MNQAMLDGHRLWNQHQVTRVTQETSVYEVTHHDAQRNLKRYIVDVVQVGCQCERFGQTGKLCCHIHAARLEHSAGPVEEIEGGLHTAII